MSRREIIAYAITHAPPGQKGGPYLSHGQTIVPRLHQAWRTSPTDAGLARIRAEAKRQRRSREHARVIRIVRARLAASGPDPMPVVRAAMEWRYGRRGDTGPMNTLAEAVETYRKDGGE